MTYTDDQFHGISECRVQQASQSLTDAERYLFGRKAKQLSERDNAVAAFGVSHVRLSSGNKPAGEAGDKHSRKEGSCKEARPRKSIPEEGQMRHVVSTH